MKEIDKLVRKIVRGEPTTSREERQLYVNHSEEIERRLKDAWETYNRRVNDL